MNWRWPFGRAKRASPPGPPTARAYDAQGPWTGALSEWNAREVAPRLYESLREAIPPLDAAINRLCTLDGILAIEAERDALLSEASDWAAAVRVNDLQQGLQALYGGMSNELYEQGHAFAEWSLAENGRDVEAVRIADAKGTYLTRNASGTLDVWYLPPAPRRGRQDGTDQVERVLRNSLDGYGQPYAIAAGYRQLDPARLVYAVLNPEADNPYGVSLLRSMEFCARILLTIDAATLQTWRRFGDPCFSVVYKTKRRLDDAALEARRQALAANLGRVMQVKSAGNSADFVQAIGADDELVIEILGGNGQVLEIEQPARHVLEQIVAKTGLPSWMLGFHWSTAERLAQRQGEIVLQESKTRFESRRPGLEALIATALRARGVTWRPGEWRLTQVLPSLQDLVAQAQAGFLQAQTEMMLRGNDEPATDVQPAKVSVLGDILWPEATGLKRARRKEGWAEADAELRALDAAAGEELVSLWQGGCARLLDALDLEAPRKSAGLAAWVFDGAQQLAALLDIEAELTTSLAGAQVRAVLAAWLRGLANAAAELGGDRVTATARAAQAAQAQARGMEQVRNVMVRAWRDDILAPLAQGVYDGSAPRDVAAALSARFDAHEYDWLRLARSEIIAAQAGAKLEQYTAHGIGQYDYVTATDDRVSAICRQLAAAGPYRVGAGPLPSRDSHPNCRCTVRARLEDAS